MAEPGRSLRHQPGQDTCGVGAAMRTSSMPANVSMAMDNPRQQARSDVTTEAWKESTVRRSDAAQQQ